MTSLLDPEDDGTSPAGPQDSASSDQSKSGIRQAWDVWTSKPENNAALLQFGVAMLQPRAPGQSAIGQFGNALGEGADASTRNLAAQSASEKQASDIESKQVENAARTTTAKAYADQVAAQGKGGGGGLKAQLAAQKAFNDWAKKGDDPISVQMNNGLSPDPIVQALSKAHPDIKTKGDILANPQYRAEARGLLAQSGGSSSEDDSGDDTTTPATTPAPAAAAPAGPQIKTFYDNQGQPRQFQLQGGKWVPYQQQ